jgi:type VI secretion system protein ImpH
MSSIQIGPNGESALPDPRLPSALGSRWGSGSSVEDRLFADGSRFNFYQAVRVLGLLYPEAAVAHLHGAPRVQFRSRMSFDFPGADIERIWLLSENETLPQMLVNFMGLAGAHGPLPTVYTGQLLREQPSALRDFLDIFNHRLIALLYRVHEMHHPELTNGSPDQGLCANHLYTFFGLGRDPESAARNRLSMPDRALLHYSGLLAHRPHSASGLQRLLCDYFEVEVAIEEFVGAWLSLAEDQWTRIGSTQGRNQTLGDGAILGKRVWDQNARIRIRLGPLDLETFESFLPQGEAYKPLNDLCRFYLGDETDFDVTLALRAEDIPWTETSTFAVPPSWVRLTSLGRLAWLKQSIDPGGSNRVDEAPKLDPMPNGRGAVAEES